MEFTAQQVAELIQGEIKGDADVKVHDVSRIEDGTAGTLTFLANPKYEHHIYNTAASIVIVNQSFVPDKEIKATLIKVPDAYQSLAKLLQFYVESQPRKTGIEQPSFIDASVQMGEFTYIGAFAYLGEKVQMGNNVQIFPHAYIGDNVVIGDNTTIYSGAKIYKNCKIGKNCTIHAGAVIGSDGFGFAPGPNNEYQKIPQVGIVVLEDFVEIGSNTTVDRATMGETIIRKGAKLDNLIQIAHNVEVGSNTVIAAQSGVAGSTKIGKNCMFGGQVGISGHIKIADGTRAGAQTGIAGNIKKPDTTLMGSPAIDLLQYQKASIIFRRLPEVYKQLQAIDKLVSDKQ